MGALLAAKWDDLLLMEDLHVSSVLRIEVFHHCRGKVQLTDEGMLILVLQ